MAALLGMIALVALAIAHAVAHVTARFAAARALGVGGVRFFVSRFTTPGANDASFARRAGVSLAGFVANYLVAVLIGLVGILAQGLTRSDSASMRVSVAPGGPADVAGMHDGDRITSAAGEAISDWDTLKRVVAAHRDAVDVGFTRDGAERTARVTPDAAGRIRVQPFAEVTHPPLGEALVLAIEEPPEIILFAITSFTRMLTGAEKPELSGPVAVASEVGRAKTAFLGMLAALSAYYLPFAALIAVLGFPRARRRPA